MRALLPLLMLCVLGCDSPTSGSGQEGNVCTMSGFKCATPTCSQFPTTPGCDYVSPTNAYCPLDRPQCFDPSKITGYCDPNKAVCAKPKMSPPPQCPSTLCTINDVETCNDTNAQLFCNNGFTCTNFGCAVDMSMGGSTDGGMPDMASGGG
jgi:hypothetical protein